MTIGAADSTRCRTISNSVTLPAETRSRFRLYTPGLTKHAIWWINCVLRGPSVSLSTVDPAHTNGFSEFSWYDGVCWLDSSLLQQAMQHNEMSHETITATHIFADKFLKKVLDNPHHFDVMFYWQWRIQGDAAAARTKIFWTTIFWYKFMIIFRRQPLNFKLNCLSYHEKCSSFGGKGPRTPHQGLCPWTPLGALPPALSWGLCLQTPAAPDPRRIPSQKSWIRHCYLM